ncbi:MAG: hypothetical protein ACKPKO_19525, partial [Candidatus Fonsibacter sp.]
NRQMIISVMAETKYNGMSRFKLKSLNHAAKAIVKRIMRVYRINNMIHSSRLNIFVIELVGLVGLGIEINAVVIGYPPRSGKTGAVLGRSSAEADSLGAKSAE